MTLLDRVMPAYDRSELHSRAVDAPPGAVWDAFHGLTADKLRLMRLLMGVRSLGRRPADPRRSVLEGFAAMGFRPVAEDPGREIVIAGIGRFWQLSGGLRRVEDGDHFAAFDEPGYAKVAFNFVLEDGRLSTETRIAGTDAQAGRRFGLYWLLVRPGSGLIRREWLRAIDREASRASPARAAGPPA